MSSDLIFLLIVVAVLVLKYVRKNVDFSEDKLPPFQPIEEEQEESEVDDSASSDTENIETVTTQQEAEPVVTTVKPDFSKTPARDVERLFGIIGKPLEHSISKVYFKKKFRTEHISADYMNFEIESAEELKDIVEANPNLCGLNVTIPFKQDVIPMMDRLDDSAARVGAVNVIKVVRNSDKTELVGFNTDAIGFMESIAPLIGDRKKALILGTGGASKAIQYALQQLGIESKFVSRNSTFDILGYYELSPSVMEEYQIIVNCTPVGMWPNSDKCPDIPYAYLTSDHLLYDVIYKPEETLFMQKGAQQGAVVKNGYEMWQRQADATWRIWNE